MATTYELIKGETLASSAAFYSFTAIPNTFTDLVLRLSLRDDGAGTPSTILVTFNSDTATNYSETVLYGTGASAASTRSSNSRKIGQTGYLVGDSAGNTSSTFGSLEMYIPNYLASANKPISAMSVEESNSASTGTYIAPLAGLWRNTAAITSIDIGMGASNFVAGSSFYLYGVKNA
jgi:hypothetical protein